MFNRVVALSTSMADTACAFSDASCVVSCDCGAWTQVSQPAVLILLLWSFICVVFGYTVGRDETWENWWCDMPWYDRYGCGSSHHSSGSSGSEAESENESW